MKYFILFALFFFTSLKISAKKCSGTKVTLMREELPFKQKFKRDFFLNDQSLVCCTKKPSQPYTEIYNLPFSMIKNVMKDKKGILIELTKKDQKQKALALSRCPTCSTTKEIDFFFATLKQTLTQRRSWNRLSSQLKQEGYSPEFHQILKKVKQQESQGTLIITPTRKGTTGAKVVKIREENGKTKATGIFKAVSEDPLHKKIAGQASLMLSARDGLAKARAEVIAFHLAKNLKFNLKVNGECLIPEAIMLNLNGEQGVFIKFLTGYREPNLEQEPFLNPNEIETRNFQMLALYDFLIGNLDRHLDNFFIKDGEIPNFEIIKFIDQGNSFPFAGPPPLSISGRNMYKWAHFSIAEKPFLPEVKNHMRHHLKIENFREAVRKIPPNLWSHFFYENPKQGAQAIKYLDLRRRFLYEKVLHKKNQIKPSDLIKFKMIWQLKSTLAKEPEK